MLLRKFNTINMSKQIHPSAQIADGVIIEDDVYIGPFCIIGYPAESKKFWDPEHKFGAVNDHTVVIKKGATLTGNVTIDAGTVTDTIIGEDCFLMKGVHIGHDSYIHPGVVMAPHVVIGGHVTVWSRTNIGMSALIHQRCEVPGGCMIGMGTVITKATHMVKDMVYVGAPARPLRSNKR